MDPPGQLEPRKVSHLLDFALGLGQLSLYSLCKLCWPPGTGPVHWDSSVLQPWVWEDCWDKPNPYSC